MNVLVAVIPVFLIILVGFLCRLKAFPDDDFWQGAEKITYYIFFPSLLIVKMADADISVIDFPLMILIIMLLLIAASVIAFIANLFLRIQSKEFSSVFQGAIRFNAYIGFAMSASLYGTEGIIFAAVISAIMIPAVNIFCVSLLEYNRMDRAQSNVLQIVIRLLKSIMTNPLLVACVVGVLLNISGITLPVIIKTTLSLLSNVALPLGVLTVGAALSLSTIKTSLLPLIFSSVIKFFVVPLLVLGLCYMFEIEGMARNVLLILSVLPTATSSYILAKQLGGDAPLMATIISGQTLLAAVLIPVLLSIVL